MLSYFKQIGAILKKDIISELRTKEMMSPVLLFVLSTMVIFSYAFNPEQYDLTPYVGGMLWLAFIFASLLGLNRSFVHEKDEGCLEGLLLAPVDRPVIYIGKMLGNLIFISTIELVAVPVFSIFFVKTNYLPRIWLFVLIILLGNLGISAVGTLLATLSINSKTRDLLLPILFLPVIIPALIAMVNATGVVITGSRLMNTVSSWLYFLIVYDIIFLLAAFGLYDYVIGE